MGNEQGLSYVRQQLLQGANPQQVKQSLLSSGWQGPDVDAMINAVLQEKNIVSVPAVTAQPTNVQTASIQPVTNTGSPLKVLIPVLILLFIVGLAAGTYFFFFTPAKILARVASSTQKIKTVTYSYNIKADIKNSSLFPQSLAKFLSPSQYGDSSKQVAGVSTSIYQTAQFETAQTTPINTGATFNILANGQADIKDINNPQFSMVLNASGKMGDQVEQAVAGEVRYLQKNLYLKVDKIPDIPEITSGINGLLGQWIKADSSEVDNLVGTSSSEDQLTPDQIKKIQVVYERNNFLKTTKTKFEMMDDVMTVHYVFSIDKTKLASFDADFSKTVMNQELTADEVQNVNDLMKYLPEINGNIWVGVFDSYLRKLDFNFQTTAAAEMPVEGTFSFSTTEKDINKPIKIDVPTNTKSLTEVESLVMGSAMDGTTSELDSDYDGLPDSLEKIWGTDPQKADTDGDGYNDGIQEVCKGYNPLGAGKITTEQQNLPKPSTCDASSDIKVTPNTSDSSVGNITL